MEYSLIKDNNIPSPSQSQDQIPELIEEDGGEINHSDQNKGGGENSPKDNDDQDYLEILYREKFNYVKQDEIIIKLKWLQKKCF